MGRIEIAWSRLAIFALALSIAAVSGGGVRPALLQGGGPSQSQMYVAASEEFKVADRSLNLAYEKLMKALEPEPRAKLKVAELAWLRFRDAEGEFRASEFKGGTLQPTARIGYLTELTRRRTVELKNAFKQFAGD